MDMFIADVGTAMRTELSNMINTHLTRITDAWDGYQIWDLITAGGAAIMTLFSATIMMIFAMTMLVLLYCITYAQVLWAQLAIAILVFLGPLFIPWLLFEPMSFLFWGWFRSLIVFSLYGALAGAVMRVFMGVALGYVTTFSNQVISFDITVMGGWVLIILPLFVAGILASLKVGELASMLVTGSAVTSSGITGAAMAAAGGGASRCRWRSEGGKRRVVMSKENETGKTYAEIWGEAIHSNRHLRVLSMGLAGLCLLLVVNIIRLSSVEAPRPIVVRVDEVGRAEALAYETVEAQADPLDPTTKYFLNRFIDDYYSRRRATVEQAWSRSLRFLTTGLANEAFRSEGENVAMLAAGVTREELQVERVILRIQANQQEPHGATADFDLVRLVNAVESQRERWTVSMQFMFLDEIPTELMVFNPMGIIVTYLRGDRALVTGE